MRWVTYFASCALSALLLVCSVAIGSPPSSASSSLSAGSLSALVDEPTPSDDPTPSESTEPETSPPPSTTPPPSSEPPPSSSSEPPSEPPSSPSEPSLSCTVETPCVVEPSARFLGVLLLIGGPGVLALLALMVRSWAR